MALGFLAFALTKSMGLVNRPLLRTIMLICTVLTYYFFKTPWVFPSVILIGGMASLYLRAGPDPESHVSKRSLKWLPLFLFFFVFIASATFSEQARKQDWPNRTPFNLFENMYRFGSFVFGGADVLIPVMYEQYVVRPQTSRFKETNQNAIKVDRESFLTAAGIVRAIPGPVFSMTAFIGGMSMKDKGIGWQILGCILASIAIFLPSFLLVIFFFPIWENLHRFKGLHRFMQGVNAAVVAIMLASIIYLTKDTLIPYLEKPAIESVFFFSVLITTCSLLVFTRIPAPLIVLGSLALALIEMLV